VGNATAQNAPSAQPFELRTEGSIPLQYSQITQGGTRQDGVTAAPYLALMAVHELQPGLTSTLFAEGGHAPIDQFRDADNTFASFGGNLVRRWDQFHVGVSLEHSRFYSGAFGPTTTIANDANIFTRYRWTPDANLRITPWAMAGLRFDDTASAQRYSFTGRVDIERRLIGSWWLVAIPRIRYANYVGDEAGRRDFTASIVAGLRYDFNANISARMLAGYENRMSNVADDSRKRLIVGVSLDFAFAAERPRW
jgi:hypothetical protein